MCSCRRTRPIIRRLAATSRSTCFSRSGGGGAPGSGGKPQQPHQRQPSSGPDDEASRAAAERAKEEREVEEVPEREAQEVEDVLRTYGLSAEDAHKVTNSIRTDKQRWVDFMMRFELGLEEPDPRRASRSAMTIAGAYVAGGLVPLSPYALVSEVPVALAWSVAVTLLALLVFGYIKGRFTTSHPWRSAWQTVLVGGLAASAAFLIAKAIG
jgi:VIT1/CCC1 family predicted Fe2+/Mn2+ transporter